MVTCPSCNTETTLVPGDALCPRCGGKLPALTATPPGLAPTAPNAPAAVDRAKNRRTLRFLLGVMCGAAALAATFILLTTDRRRRNDLPHLELQAHPLPRAEDSATLGMLPAHCNLLAEVKLRQLLKVKLGSQLMKQPVPPWIDDTLGKLHDWLGLKLGQIDDIALGVDAAGGTPALWLIVETSRDLEPAWFDAQRRRRAETFRGRPMYDFDAGTWRGVLWLAYKRLAVVQLRRTPDSLRSWDALPETPRSGLDNIDPALHSVFKENRVEPEHLAWLAGTGAGVQTLTPWLRVAGADLGPLADNARTVSLGLLLRDKATISVNFFTADEKKSDAVRAALAALAEPIHAHVKVAGPQPSAPAAEQWVTLFLSLPLESLRDADVRTAADGDGR
jgi:hypothetical protein